MKNKTTKSEYIEEIAMLSMQSILNGIYNNPGAYKVLSDVATERKIPLTHEVAERSFMMAKAMWETKQKFLTSNNTENE